MNSTLKEHATIAVDRGPLSGGMKAWIFFSVLLLVAAWVGVFFDPLWIVPHAVMLFWPLWLGAWIAIFCSMRYPLERARHTLFQLEITSLTPEGIARSFMRRPVKLGLILLVAAAPLYMLPHQRDLFAIAANPVSHAFTATLIMRPVMFVVSLFGFDYDSQELTNAFRRLFRQAYDSRTLIGRCGIFESIGSGALSLLMDAFRLYAVAAVVIAATIRSRRAGSAFLRMLVRICALLIATALVEIAIGVNLLLFVCGVLPNWLSAAITVLALVAIAGWLHSYWRQRQLLGRTATEASGVPAIDGLLAASLFKSGRDLGFVGGSLCLSLGMPLVLICMYFLDSTASQVFQGVGSLWLLSMVILLTGLIASIEVYRLSSRSQKRDFFGILSAKYQVLRAWGPRLKLWVALLIVMLLVSPLAGFLLPPPSWVYTSALTNTIWVITAVAACPCLVLCLLLAPALFRLLVIAWRRKTQSVVREGFCWSLQRTRRWYASTLLIALLLASGLTCTVLHIRVGAKIVGRYPQSAFSLGDKKLLLRMPTCILAYASHWVFDTKLSQARSPEAKTRLLIELLGKKELVSSRCIDRELWLLFTSDPEICRSAMTHPRYELRVHATFHSYLFSDHYSQIIPQLIRMADEDPSDVVQYSARVSLFLAGRMTEQLALHLALRKPLKHNYGGFNVLRPFGKSIASSLVSELDGQHGQQALLLLSEMGPLAREAVPALIARLKTSHQENRRLAISGLAMIGPAARLALPMLRKTQLTGAVLEKALAGYAIWRITGESSGVALDLLQARKFNLLRNMGPAANEIQPQLLKELLVVGYDRSRVVAALGRTPLDPVPQLIKLLTKSKQDSVRWVAVRALREIEPAPPEALPVLLSALSDVEAYECENIVQALLRLGPPGPLTVKALEQEVPKLLSSNKFCLLLARAGQVSQKTATILRQTMGAPNYYNTPGPAMACYRLNIDKKFALKVLLKQFASQSSYSLVKVIDALGRTGAGALPAVPALKKILEGQPKELMYPGKYYLRIRAGVALWRITGNANVIIPCFRKMLAESHAPDGYGPELLKVIGEMGADAEPLIQDIERQMNMSFPNLKTNRQARKTIAKIKAAVKARKASPNVLRNNPPR
jgi:HEAT repeat protein